MKHFTFLLLILLLRPLTLLPQVVTTGDPYTAGRKLGHFDLILESDTNAVSVTSASRTSKKLNELPITIHLIENREIISNHYTSLIEVLKHMPGVRVSQPGNGEMGETFQLRGLVGNLYTLIMINGVPVKPSVVVGMPILEQLPVKQAERIEVIYGPAAAVYGADAVSGVINIVTREAEKGTFAMGEISMGPENYFNTNFIVGGKAGKNKNILQYSFYGGKSGARDYSIKAGYEDVYNPLNYLQEREVTFNINGNEVDAIDINESTFAGTVSGSAGFIDSEYPDKYVGSVTLPQLGQFPSESNMLGLSLRFRDFNLTFNNIYRRSHSSLGLTTYLFRYNNPQNFWGENINTASLSFNHRWLPWLSTFSNISSLSYRMDNNSSMGVNFIEYTDKVYRYSAGNDLLFEQLVTFYPSGKLEIVSGVAFQYSGNLPQTNFLDAPFITAYYKPFSTRIRRIDNITNNFGIKPLNFRNLSGFFQAYYSLNRIRFMGGLRVDSNSLYGISYSPRIACLYPVSDRSTLRGSVGFAFKAPPSSLSHQALAHHYGSTPQMTEYLIWPNPELSPENFMSVELGILRNMKSGIQADISVYYNEIRNVIASVYRHLEPGELPGSEQDSVLYKTNQKTGVSRLYGLQATFKAPDLVKKINLDAELSLTFAKAGASTEFPDIFRIAGNFLSDLSLTPNHFGQLKVSLEPARNLYLNVSTSWESNWLRIVIPIEKLYNKLFGDIPGFYTMDICADYGISENLHAFIKAYNIFDEKYGGPVYSVINAALPYSPQNGRTFHIGLTYTLN